MTESLALRHNVGDNIEERRSEIMMWWKRAAIKKKSIELSTNYTKNRRTVDIWMWTRKRKREREIVVRVYELHMHAQFSSTSSFSSFRTYFSPFSFGINNSTVRTHFDRILCDVLTAEQCTPQFNIERSLNSVTFIYIRTNTTFSYIYTYAIGMRIRSPIDLGHFDR